MKKYIYISIGGILGVFSRFLLKNLQLNSTGNSFPTNILLINVTGAFLIAFILTLAAKAITISVELRLGLTTGFLGGFTTFSALCKDAYNLVVAKEFYIFLIYVLGSVFAGLVAVLLGIITARSLEHLFVRRG